MCSNVGYRIMTRGDGEHLVPVRGAAVRMIVESPVAAAAAAAKNLVDGAELGHVAQRRSRAVSVDVGDLGREGPRVTQSAAHRQRRAVAVRRRLSDVIRIRRHPIPAQLSKMHTKPLAECPMTRGNRALQTFDVESRCCIDDKNRRLVLV